MFKAPFFELKGIKEPRLEDGFSLDTLLLEEEMRQYNGGIDLASVDSTTNINEKLCRRFVPSCSDRRDVPSKSEVLGIADLYPEVDSPCSMSIDSTSELADHMSAAYQVAHFHYILGKRYDLKGSFPKWCCGRSGRSVMLSLLTLGYPNAAYAYSDLHDHGYTILPFVFSSKGVCGALLIDPTFDQTQKSDEHPIRNPVFLKLSDRWEYRNGWANRHDLFPDKICAIDTLRINSSDITNLKYYHQNSAQYFDKAFANSIKLEKFIREDLSDKLLFIGA